MPLKTLIYLEFVDISLFLVIPAYPITVSNTDAFIFVRTLFPNQRGILVAFLLVLILQPNIACSSFWSLHIRERYSLRTFK
jgi:hypothetical protein